MGDEDQTEWVGIVLPICIFGAAGLWVKRKCDRRRLRASAAASGQPPVAEATVIGAPIMAVVTVRVPPGSGPGQLLQVRTPHGSMIQCNVPPGSHPGSTFQVQYPIPANAPQVIDENIGGKVVEGHLLPKYWTNVKYVNNTAFDQMVYVGREQHDKFDELLAKTYVQKATQDRQCPKGTCAKKPGGCPCVQPTGNPGLPVGYRVLRVIRVEDSEMWSRYVEKRNSIQARRRNELPLPKLSPPAKTDELARSHQEVFEPLDGSLNEVYLWHGTDVRRALSIAQDDFKIDLAGTTTGTMYGRGAYLAECSTKADEYAKDEPDGFYKDVFALLLCRVCIGKFFYTTERDESAGSKVKSGTFDSTCGDRAKSAGTYREFVVYDNDALYPEYVVLYTRVSRADDPAVVEAKAQMPFHMQLPVYWSNCHKDPRVQQFNEQFRVRTSTRTILQRLVEASYSEQGKQLTILGARRIEHSGIWNKYVEMKQVLRAQLQRRHQGATMASKSSTSMGNPRFTPPEELDGDAASGHVLTHVHLQGELMEESISISNLEESLNECLLWHGTSESAAETIVRDDFHIPQGSAVRHGARFGAGAYFAEDIAKSLTYAMGNHAGVKYALLCRVLCGDMYYTRAQEETDAHLRRQKAGKNTVLADPMGQGPREFVVTDAAQVYPEYILELRIDDVSATRLCAV